MSESKSIAFHNLKYRISKDDKLTDKEKEKLLEKLVTNEDVPNVILLKKNMILKKKRYICPVCGKDFTDKIGVNNLSTKTYCSEECATIAFNANRRKKKGVILGVKICKRCGIAFKPKANSSMRCDGCNEIHRRERRKVYKETFKAKHKNDTPIITKKCECCGTLLNNNNKKYCSTCKPFANKVMVDRATNIVNGSTVADSKKACIHCGIAYKDYFINKKGECPKCAKLHMSEKDKLRIKFTKEQKRIDKLTTSDFLKAVQAQIVLNDAIKKHFPEGLNEGG